MKFLRIWHRSKVAVGNGCFYGRQEDGYVLDVAVKIMFRMRVLPCEDVEDVMDTLHKAVAVRDSAWI